MLTTVFLMTIVSILVLPACLWLYALVDVVMNEFDNLGIKVAWLLALAFFPPVATIFYFLIGREQRVTRYKAGKTVIFIILLIPILLIIVINLMYFGNFAVQPDIPETIRI
jgi:accessory gene regulator protein AgrB